MLEEAFGWIANIVRHGTDARVRFVDGIKDQALVQYGDGTHEWKDLEGLHPRVSLESLDALVDFAGDTSLCKEPEVYIQESKVTLIPNASDRSVPFHTLALERSARCKVLWTLTENVWAMTPGEAIKKMRRNLHATGTGTQALIDSLRAVEFTRSDQSSHQTRKGKESLGKRVEAAVSGLEDAIPDAFNVECQYYRTPGFMFQFSVPVQVHVDPAAEKIELWVDRDEMSEAQRSIAMTAFEVLRKALPEMKIFEASHRAWVRGSSRSEQAE